ncbi:ShlB/FhaC/HecB family hemolysin secretion/activation protein [Agarilytica rhodophyticola]|uniref:ShlB/FhaC/HecB family hemolysin secretion/activation protein n=1 Tax=Agarilytica rhodophyticola TaxID=1737490 RepID=UPI0013154278|nr:ShlB/FhaC/HecB family hemolysin secretion/activation protein [Agarilytica rhodophyticola]
MIKHSKRLLGFFLFSSLGLATANGYAQGFLEMPDITEVPDYEKESLLLDLDIPPVRDRDPDPEAGPRLNVREFRLQGLVEFPKLGITREELIKRVEAIRFDLMDEGKLTESGYTLDELGEISDLMADIEKKTEGQHVGPLEVQRLVFLIREQRRRRGVTLGMIETVADTITRYYRERGFILAKAYIPEQKVRDGVVNLTLLLGELGEINTENNRRVSDRLIESVFKRDINKPVTSWRTEEALYLVNDIPGLSAQGFFQPGSQVGDTRLNVNVLGEKRYTASFRVDNHGSPRTGENRVYGDFAYHNPLGIGDELRVSVLNTFDPDNTTFGAISYNSFIANPRIRGQLSFSTNDFVSNNRSATNSSVITVVTGQSDVSEASLRYIFKRSRVKNISMELKAVNISTELLTSIEIDGNAGGDGLGSGSEAQNISLGFNFDILNQKRRQLYLGNLSVVSTDVEINDDIQNQLQQNQDGQVVFLTHDLSMLAFWRIPFTSAETRFFVKSAGQYSGKVMNSINQFNLTGPDRVRGFEVNSLQFDDSIYLGVDWIFTLPKFGGASLFGEPINKVFQPFMFVDSGYGILYSRLEGEPDVNGTLASAGVGIKFNHSSFSGSFTYAEPTTDDIDTGAETPLSRFYFDLQYVF